MTEVGDNQSLVSSLRGSAFYNMFKDEVSHAFYGPVCKLNLCRIMNQDRMFESAGFVGSDSGIEVGPNLRHVVKRIESRINSVSDIMVSHCSILLVSPPSCGPHTPR